jgi:hypothetical protein
MARPKINVKTITHRDIVFKDVSEDGHRVIHACGVAGSRYAGVTGRGHTHQAAFDDLQERNELLNGLVEDMIAEPPFERAQRPTLADWVDAQAGYGPYATDDSS